MILIFTQRFLVQWRLLEFVDVLLPQEHLLHGKDEVLSLEIQIGVFSIVIYNIIERNSIGGVHDDHWIDMVLLEDRRNFFWEYPSSIDKTILQGVELVVLLQLLRQRLSSTSDLLMNSNHWFVIFLGESKSIIEGVEAN